MSPLLTVPEAANALRCSPRRVWQLIADGTLQRGPKYGRQAVVTRESVEAATLPPEPPPTKKRYRAKKTFEEELADVAARRRALRPKGD